MQTPSISKKECIEVVSIPDSVTNNKLEDKVVKFFQKIEYKQSPSDTEACHRLRKNSDKVLVNFSRR